MDRGRRLLIYSHDSFGLGHLRRCRTIAHDLVTRYDDLSVLILSGSPIIGSFDFKSRVDFVRVPGVIKLRNGDYTPLNLHIDIDTTLGIRSSIIQHTADIFAPEMLIVDKEPLGLRGEVRPTLEMLRARGTRCILGLRDVMDEPSSLIDEWERKGVFPQLDRLYDEIWVYGLPEMCDLVAEIPGLRAVAHKIRYTGYLRRSVPENSGGGPEIDLPAEPFILVTTGGGGDGEELVDWVISAYESDPDLPYSAVILFGPFLPTQARQAFQERVSRDRRLRAIVFETRVESLYERAVGVVGMGGYNTFCEIMSFGKPALIVPRTVPRLEQAIRAERAQQLGLVRMLPYDSNPDPRVMASMLRQLPHFRVPREETRARMLRGLNQIGEFVSPWLSSSIEAPQRRAAGLG